VEKSVSEQDPSNTAQRSRKYARSNIMPTYILLSTLTPEGRQTLHKDPDRMETVNKEITEFGCKVVAQYAVLGQCDFVTIVEAADNETVAHLSVDLGSRGTVNITTLPAIPIADLRAKMKGPKQMGRAGGHRPTPGGI
jgi:uncharacterized protein with GYD domain